MSLYLGMGKKTKWRLHTKRSNADNFRLVMNFIRQKTLRSAVSGVAPFYSSKEIAILLLK